MKISKARTDLTTLTAVANIPRKGRSFRMISLCVYCCTGGGEGEVKTGFRLPQLYCPPSLPAVAYRRGVWGGFNTPPKFRRPSNIVPNSARLWKLSKIADFRTPTPQDVRKKGSKILKLPLVRNCFILGMTNKLVVIIHSLKVPKIKKILLYEMKFLVRNYSCLQNPWRGVHRPQIPVLCPQPNFLTPPKFRRPSKIVPNSTRLWKLLNTAEFRKPTPQDIRKKKAVKF